MSNVPAPPSIDPAAGLDFSKPAARRGRKLPPALVAVVLAIVLAGGGYAVYAAVYAVRGYDLSKYEDNDGPGANLRERLFAATRGEVPGAAVVRRAGGGGDVRLPAARIRFRKTGGAIVIDSGYYDMRFVAPADYDAYLARAAALGDEKTALTPEQREKLRLITFTSACVRSEEDKKTLTALWEKYEAAPADAQPAIAEELKKVTARVAVASMPLAAADYAAAAKQVRAILTEEQIRVLRFQNR
ncbi:MAG TPA: hypothetical protein VF624_02180 [Tepidisphaeraceae bacterium]|jgi:hypothetical protein